MTHLRLILHGLLRVVMQYFVFVIAHASITTDSMAGLLVAASLQTAIITLIVRAHIRYWKP